MPAAPKQRARPQTAALANLSGRAGQSKLAATVASRIVDEVVASGWPVGEVLGSSAEFLERFDISRAVFREAVRLLEHEQVVTTRRGPGGGLVVAQPSTAAITDAAVIYLHRVDARLDEVLEARVVLEDIVAELAAARINSAGRSELEDLVAAESRGEVRDREALHALLARSSRNPALELTIDILGRVSRLYSRRQGTAERAPSAATATAHRSIAKAVLEGDVSLARARMRDHMERELAELRGRPSMRQMLPPGAALSVPDGVKLAEGVAREVAHEVVSGRLQPGHLLGSEADLMEGYGVSRAVLREAVRLLEHHQIAQMRRGPGGGLFVVEPSSAAVADVVAIYLASRGAGTTALAELRARVEAALVGLVIDRMDDAGAAALEESLEVGEGDEDADVSIHNLHASLARLSGNRVLELISLVLIRLTRFHQAQELTRAQAAAMLEEVNRIHLGIARAIQAKDLPLAQKRIRRHLDVLTTHLH